MKFNVLEIYSNFIRFYICLEIDESKFIMTVFLKKKYKCNLGMIDLINKFSEKVY